MTNPTHHAPHLTWQHTAVGLGCQLLPRRPTPCRYGRSFGVVSLHDSVESLRERNRALQASRAHAACPKKIVNHCGIHSEISSRFATCLASCVLNVAKLLVLISE